MSNGKLRIGITHGDINGVGYEIIIKTLTEQYIHDNYTTIVYGSPKAAAFYRKQLNMDNFSFNSINTPEEANPKRTNLINIASDALKVELGKITPIAGEASVAALKAVVRDLKQNSIDVVVTAPINKSNIQDYGYNFPGHTEYFAAEFGVEDYMMLMVNEVMRIGFVTSHIPLSNVPQSLSKELILKKLRVMHQSLMVDFMIRKPRIALLSVNPHNGDNGLLGDEENTIIQPAIDEAKENDMLVFGPYPGDGFFGTGLYKEFDGILAMYHDQGMIPFKTLSYGGGVNFTAGLPIVRTSPAHGTAYDIAGQNKANYESFRDALFLASEIYKNRKLYAELTANPLNKIDPESI